MDVWRSFKVSRRSWRRALFRSMSGLRSGAAPPEDEFALFGWPFRVNGVERESSLTARRALVEDFGSLYVGAGPVDGIQPIGSSSVVLQSESQSLSSIVLLPVIPPSERWKMTTLDCLLSDSSTDSSSFVSSSSWLRGVSRK